VAAFGEDGKGSNMAALLKMLYQNGAAEVVAVAVAEAGGVEDYAKAFAALEKQEVGIIVCDSGDIAVQQRLRESVAAASGARRERIAVVGSTGENVKALVARAKALNHERVVLVAGEGIASDGKNMGGIVTAAAVAGVIAATSDPAIPLNGAEINGIYGVEADYTDEDIDALVRGGVTPLESVAGTVSTVRGVTTKTSTGGAADTTWREISTILIVDDVIPQIRNALRRKFSRSKNTAQTRSAIRSQVIVELENKKSAEIIDSFGAVEVRAAAEDATICEVEFSFAVAHGLNQIYLTAHITV
jgi:hypothetical protein